MGVSQIKNVSDNATKNAKGIALVAGHRRPTMSIKIVAIGITASKAKNSFDMFEIFWVIKFEINI